MKVLIKTRVWSQHEHNSSLHIASFWEVPKRKNATQAITFLSCCEENVFHGYSLIQWVKNCNLAPILQKPPLRKKCQGGGKHLVAPVNHVSFVGQISIISKFILIALTPLISRKIFPKSLTGTSNKPGTFVTWPF